MAALRYVSQHDETVFGGLVVLTLATSVLLIIRQIGQKNLAHAGGEGEAASAVVNVGEIEDAMKRVLSTQAISVKPAGASGGAGLDEVENSAELAVAVRERDQKIQEMQASLEKLQTELAAAPAAAAVSAAPVGASAEDLEKLKSLEAKIGELTARLQEYEIIEDDIADLSMFKEENQRLKHEVERLRSGSAAPPAPEPAPAPAAVEAAPDASMSADDLAALDAASAAADLLSMPAPESVSEIKERVALDQSDDVMRQFAAAVEVQRAPPPDAALKVESVLDAAIELGAEPTAQPSAEPAAVAAAASSDEDSPLSGALDPDKVMSEIDMMPVAESASDALEDSLDTDKLLAEVGSLSAEPVAASAPAPAAPASAPVAPPPAAAATPAAPPVAAAPPPPMIPAFDPNAPDAPMEEDLLAEFKDFKDTKN